MSRIVNPYVHATLAEVGAPSPQLAVQLMPQYAQCGEDYIALSMLRALALREGIDLTKARYLEVGANHPIASSATYLLHVGLGMTGVLVEPNPRLFETLKSYRPHDTVLQCAVTDRTRTEVDFFISSLNELSSLFPSHIENFSSLHPTIVERISVPARSLDHLLSEEFRDAPPLFMSVDIEGADLAVLQAWSFLQRPYLIQVEANEAADKDKLNALALLLRQRNYGIIASTDVNQLAVDLERFQPSHPGESVIRSLGVSSSQMHGLLEPFKLLTLDVFDTILVRRGLAPTDVFAWIERKLLRPGFCDARIEAEALARRKYASRGKEVSLEEIYSCFANSGLGDEDARVMELEAERRFVFANPNIRDLISVAKQMGRRVVAISDIYLPASQIEELLREAGVHLDKVYSSCDFRQEDLGKYNGRLFPRVLELEGITANAVLHIGDNVVSDIENAGQHGISALHTRNLHDAAAESSPVAKFIVDAAETRTGSIIAGLVTKSLTDRNALPSVLEQYGFAIGGPVVCGYIQFIQSTARTLGIERLVLLERDGCIIAEAAIELGAVTVPWRLAPSSRRMTALPCLAVGDEQPLVRLFSKKPISEADFFDALTLPLPLELGVKGGRMAPPAQHISRHRDLLMAQAERELQALRSYLKEELEIVAAGGKIAWVDVGWALSSAAALNKALGIDASCFCIGSNTGTPNNLAHDGYLFELEQPAEIGSSIMQAVEPVELIFASTRPSTSYLVEEQGAVTRVSKPQAAPELLRNGAIQDVSRGILHFCAEISDLFPGLDADELRAHNRKVVSGFCAAPPLDVYKAFARVPHDRRAVDKVWNSIGDFWRPLAFHDDQGGRSYEDIHYYKAKLVEARRHPMRLVKDKVLFKVLRTLSRFAPPLPKSMAKRFARSASKRDPNRKDWPF